MSSKIRVIILSMSLLVINNIHSQKNIDSIFNLAVENARIGNYGLAIGHANQALRYDSLRADIMTYLANVYSWSGKTDSALVYINKAKRLNYVSSDFYDSYLNILLQSNKYDELLMACDEAEKNGYLNKKNIIVKKLIVYQKQTDYKTGVEMMKVSDNQLFLKDETVDELYTALLLKQRSKMISANYTLDAFDSSRPQHLASVGFSFKEKLNSYGLSFNHANRFGNNDEQLESTVYLVSPSESYWYLNYGYGFNASLFPKHRAGIEYYFNLNKTTDASFGGRYMYYSNAVNKDIYILTGHLGTYFGKNWVSFRPYYVRKKILNSYSAVVKYRLYGRSTFDFWGTEIGFGNSPDDIANTTQGNYNELNSFHWKIEKNFRLNRTSDLFVAWTYTNEQVLRGVSKIKQNRYSFDIGYKYRF